ncbi:SGNH/GDSL hydrolase family protein [soil metagenome]
MLTLLAFTTALLTSAAAPPDWIAAWTYAPTAVMLPVGVPTPPRANDPRGPGGPGTVADATLTQTVRLMAGGERIRIRVSNLYRASDLDIGRASISQGQGAPTPILFDGHPDLVLPVGASRLSDPITLPVDPLDQVAVRLFLPDETILPIHQFRQTLMPGDATGASGLPAEAEKVRMGSLLSAIEVESTTPLGVIVAMGDSITEGTGALPSPQGVRGWPERLGERMIAGRKPWAVVNAGIGGNRLLHQSSGPSGLERLDADALVVSGARCLILLEGVNDIRRPARREFAHQPVTADDLIAGYRQVAARAHAAGLRLVVATIPPSAGSENAPANGEPIRQSANAWIRASPDIDARIDFDAVLRDPADPSRLRADYQSGDWLHPNDAGYQAMADAIPLEICD